MVDTDNNKNHQGIYLIVPIFNFAPSNDILNVEFGGYKFLDNVTFFKGYASSFDYDKLKAIEEIRIDDGLQNSTKLTTSYLLIKKISDKDIPPENFKLIEE